MRYLLFLLSATALAGCAVHSGARTSSAPGFATADSLLHCARLAVNAEGFDALSPPPGAPGRFTARRISSLGARGERGEYLFVWVVQSADSVRVRTKVWETETSDASGSIPRPASPGLHAMAAQIEATCPGQAVARRGAG